MFDELETKVEKKKDDKKCGLWVKKKEDGSTNLVGNFQGERVVIFKNKFKKEDKQPDYILKFYPIENKTPSVVEEDTLPF